jgi:hypothetical protein
MPALPEGFNLCRHFREWRDELLNDPEVRTNLMALRENHTIVFGEWLEDYEVSLAMASATLAITVAQDIDGGFSCMGQTDVQQCLYADEAMAMDPMIRPGRPTIIPLQHHAHFTVIVIQLDDDGNSTYSILDSKAHYYPPELRNEIFRAIQTMMKTSQWGRTRGGLTGTSIHRNRPTSHGFSCATT